MSFTPEYDLFLTDDDHMFFRDWREQINGQEDSNMTKIDAALREKQDKLIGQSGQMVGFSSDGDAIAQDMPAGVRSFNGRKDDIVPQAGDYTADMVGALSIGGGELTGPLTLSGSPSSDLQAATKAYVDASIQEAILSSWEASY